MRRISKPKTTNELYNTIRKDWGDINPVTKVDKDKSKYTRKKKHREKFDY